MGLTRFPNGLGSFFVDNSAVEQSAAYTIALPADSGKTFTSSTDGMVFTLPVLATGATITFVNMAPDGAAGISISPNTANGITYAGTEVANKDLINTKATAKQGDYVTLASLDGTTNWQVVAARGIWAKEA